MSTGAYAPDKALAHPDRLRQLKGGEQPYPVHLHLILSDLCDLDCPQCAYRLSGYSSNEMFGELRNGKYTHNPNRMLETGLVLRVLADCADIGCKAIECTGGGEPTIHPDAPWLLQHALDLGLDVALVTNGLHLHRMEAVVPRLSWLRISLDASTPQTYATVRPSFGGPKDKLFQKCCDQIKAACALRDRMKSSVTIGVGFVVQEGNWREIYDVCKLAKELGAQNVRLSGAFTPTGDKYHDAYRREAIELERRAIVDLDGKDGFRVYGRFHEKLADLAGPPKVPTCWYQNLTTYLGGDGNLYRCCVTSYNKHGLIGSVREAGGLKALWDSTVKRERFQGFDARSCVRCQFNDKLEAIERAVTAPVVPALPLGDFQHVNFV